MLKSYNAANGTNKQMGHFNSNKNTYGFLTLVKDRYRNNDVAVIEQVKGGDTSSITQGTWMCPELAMYFAQWLSPEFHLACNDFILSNSEQFLASVQKEKSRLQYHMPKLLLDSEILYKDGKGKVIDGEYTLEVTYNDDCLYGNDIKYNYSLVRNFTSHAKKQTGDVVSWTLQNYDSAYTRVERPRETVEYKLECLVENDVDVVVISKRVLWSAKKCI